MADRRRRIRNKKAADDVRQIPVTIAKREDPRVGVVQPKILLKKEPDSCYTRTNEHPSGVIKTIIVNRSYVRSNNESSQANYTTSTAALGSASASIASIMTNSSNKDKFNNATVTQNTDIPGETAPRMTRSTPLLAINGMVNANARKMFHKKNTDFTVIGVMGTQSMGKSTLLNLLAADRCNDYDFYGHLFSRNSDDCIFSMRHKSNSNKSALRPRTEALQFFITKERFILLDTPPIMSSASPKDVDFFDMQMVSHMAQLLSVCHVLLFTVDEYGLQLLRVLNIALRLRPQIFTKSYDRNYLPNVIFVRTRAKRHHFESAYRERMDKQLAQLYGNTELNIFRGRGDARCVNSFIFPEVNSGEPTAYHANLSDIVQSFRERVLTTKCSHMCTNNDFSESAWFELMSEIARKGTQNFEKIYAAEKSRHLDSTLCFDYKRKTVADA